MKTNYVAIIPTYNSAEHLERCLQSISGATAWLWDQGSTDATLDIAARYGAVVRHWPYKWDEVSEYVMRMEATNTVLKHFPDCTHVLCLDSDEILTHNWREEFDSRIEWYPDLHALRVPYWQLICDSRYGAVNNPIEYRLVCCAAGKGPLFNHDGTIRWHQCVAYVNGLEYFVPQTFLIHLGYTGDLRKRFQYNHGRGDWPHVTREDLEKRLKMPWNYLESVSSTPQWLIDKCLTLRAIIQEHSKTRTITVTGTEPALRISNIEYH